MLFSGAVGTLAGAMLAVAIVLGALVLAALASGAGLALLAVYAVVFVVGLAWGFANPSSSALEAMVVPREQLARADLPIERLASRCYPRSGTGWGAPRRGGPPAISVWPCACGVSGPSSPPAPRRNPFWRASGLDAATSSASRRYGLRWPSIYSRCSSAGPFSGVCMVVRRLILQLLSPYPMREWSRLWPRPGSCCMA